MSDHTKDCCEYNVACDVSNCAYNADGKRCHADHIQVKNTPNFLPILDRHSLPLYR